MQELNIQTEFIVLGQALKLAGLVDSGSLAKIVIQNGEVLVNGEIETRRGKKLYNGDRVSFLDREFIIKNED
ncbi:MAG: RNA-binding S4 domain-containing protein [Erysipelotrichaceae bacterium]|nr:RNA-binding S4 domain-containing protein [Erysipelotrichaceae bacterium]